MNRIQEMRKEKGLTQLELAKEVGVSDASINKYEKGIMIPKIDKLEKMADLFSVSVAYLTGESSLKDEASSQVNEGATLIVWLNDGKTLHFEKVTNLENSDFELTFDYFGQSTQVDRAAVFNQINIAGFALQK